MEQQYGAASLAVDKAAAGWDIHGERFHRRLASKAVEWQVQFRAASGVGADRNSAHLGNSCASLSRLPEWCVYVETPGVISVENSWVF